MRINVYAEEMTDRVEIISKEIEGQKFTGLRFYLELPVTVDVCSHCGVLKPGPKTHGIEINPCRVQVAGLHLWQTRQISGPFMHHPGDDDSSAVTFWGKRDLREVLEKALAKLDEHYGKSKPPRAVEVPPCLWLTEEDRQMVLLALAVLSLESPGFDHALNEIAKRIDNVENDPEGDSRAMTYDKFRDARRRGE